MTDLTDQTDLADLAHLDAATALLRARLADVAPDQWDAPSPCEGWTARDVAEHVIGDAVRYRLWVIGAPAEEVTASRALTFLGDDPVAALDEIQGALRAAFAEPGALDRTARHSAGDITGRDLLELRLLEQTLHAWDIAVATGSDPAIGDDLCARLIGSAATIERLRGHGYYGPATALAGPGDTLQDRLLRLAGRR
ncbi:TIGR03086 family metal-binding protein [Nocardioides sp. WV_118_6]|uniref:TIGR03086 family metal-binding protein n=1 Tax=Nocardioides simplex TaxID=2045 RepID=UPI002150000C|nr:TIGR03086 family metal-binding protein [Pimelobacter simplex]UUW88115.1 TIGR03086 family metal-binding protein [Pimelobacter simplex]UUW97619.1 TIGR03086 family metal-binding protein [Pimelobacter simplex]